MGLYRDDDLVLLKSRNGRDADKTRKMLHTIFEQIGLKITAKVNNQLVDFLDVTLNSRSNHPPCIIKQVPKSINQRLSSLSSDKQSFDSCKSFYEHALKQSDYDVSLHFSDCKSTTTPPCVKRKRQRNTIWYNPPFSKSVKSNVARNFLHLFDKHFPVGSPKHKLFNRNNVKISYSCMHNVKSIIARHNKRILSSNTQARI